MSPNYSYSRRLVQSNVEATMKVMPVTFLAGPRQSGKTTFLKAFQDEDSGKDWRHFNLDYTPHLEQMRKDAVGVISSIPAESVIAIDEVQFVPELFNVIKHDVFERYAPGRFLLTGSANPVFMSKIRESLAGRMGTVRFHPFSVCEKLGVAPSFLQCVLDGAPPASQQARSRDFILEQLVVGGYPVPNTINTFEERYMWHEGYIEKILQDDVVSMEGFQRYDELKRLLTASMSITGRLLNYTSLAKTVAVSDQTIKRYLGFLEAWFLLDRVSSWHGNVQRKLRKQRKLHYLDTGLACTRLGWDKDHIQSYPSVHGQLVESFVYSELMKLVSYLPKARCLGVSHYRDNNGLEIDIVIEKPGGTCYAFEVKAGEHVTSKDLMKMKAFKKIAGENFRMGIVMHDGKEVSQFGEGLFVVPLSALWS